MFKGLLVFMDNSTSNIIVLLHELITICVKIPCLRDELILQIIKQLTNNFDVITIENTWKFLSLLLATVPPSNCFENYLELWLRKRAIEGRYQKMFNYPEQCLHNLHLSIYRGVSTIPSHSNIAKALY